MIEVALKRNTVCARAHPSSIMSLHFTVTMLTLKEGLHFVSGIRLSVQLLNKWGSILNTNLTHKIEAQKN